MGVIGDTIGKVTGGIDFGSIFTGIFKGVGIIVGFIFIAIIVTGLGYLYWNSKRFSKKITILKNVSGRYIFAGTDKARVAKMGDMGNEVLYLKKLKVFRMSQGILIDKNTYLFAIDKEGNWLNVGLADINRDLLEMNYEIPSNDSRLSNVAIRRLNERQFEKKNWLKENVGVIAGGIIIIVVVLFLWLMADKYFTIFDAQRAILVEQKELNIQNTETVRVITKLVETMDNMLKGGGAFTPVT